MKYHSNSKIAIGTLLSLGLLAGCATDGTSNPRDTTPIKTTPQFPAGAFGESRIFYGGTCETTLEMIKAIALTEVTPWGLEEGGYIRRDGEFDIAVGVPEMAGVEESMSSDDAAGSSSGDFSETNTQEQGVDEGDTIESDGEYIYKVDNSRLKIFRVRDLTEVATINLPDGEQHMILSGGYLGVATSSWSGGETTYLRIINVENPEEPQVEQTLTLEGRTTGVRSVNGQMRTVLSDRNHDRLDFVTPWEDGLDEDEALEENKKKIENSTIADWLPRHVLQGGDIESVLECNQIAIPDDGATMTAMTWVASIDLESGSELKGQIGITSGAENLYATANSLHFTTTDWDVDVDWGQDNNPTTTVHSFGYNDNETMYHSASGTVPGTVLNQFSLGWHKDHLRIATTYNKGGISQSAIHVLGDAENESYQVVGKVEGLGETERIFAVRYMGDIAAVVTFRQTDPLYLVDLSDPANPQVTGELKIPGYSSYLHPVGESHLIGIGQDADNSGRTRGTQISLFNIENLFDPQRVDITYIGGNSAAETDHKAFLYWPASGSIVTSDYSGTTTVTNLNVAAEELSKGQSLEVPGQEECEWWWDGSVRTLIAQGDLIRISANRIDRYNLDTLKWEAGKALDRTDSGDVMWEDDIMIEPAPDMWCE